MERRKFLTVTGIVATGITTAGCFDRETEPEIEPPALNITNNNNRTHDVAIVMLLNHVDQMFETTHQLEPSENAVYEDEAEDPEDEFHLLEDETQLLRVRVDDGDTVEKEVDYGVVSIDIHTSDDIDITVKETE